MDFVKDFSFDRKFKREVINIRARFNDLREDLRLYGKSQEIDNNFTRLRFDILDFVEEIRDNYPRQEVPLRENSTSSNRAKSTKNVHHVKPKRADLTQSQAGDSNQTRKQREKTALERNKEKFLRQRNQRLSLTKPHKQDKRIVFKGTGLTKTYPKKSIAFTLHPIDLELKSGEITAVVGENGNGKTTLLEIIAGNLMQTDGDLQYYYLSKNDQKNYYEIKQQIAYITQDLPKWSGLLIDNLHFAAAIRGIKGSKNEEEVDFIISRLGLDKYRKATWNEISGGFKMRFALAKALVWGPKLLILDEPLANLDLNTQLFFLQDLRDIADSLSVPMSIILSSQHLHMIESITDNIVFLHDGMAKYNGKLNDFGEDRQENSFEIACDLLKEELTDLLDEALERQGIEVAGHHFIIHTSKEVTPRNLLEIFVEKNITLTYFRDISKSTRKLFKIQP